MMEQKITKQQLEQILTAFFPGGYSKGGDDSGDGYLETWYLGWFNGDGNKVPMEINLDGGGTMLIAMLYDTKDSGLNIDKAKGFVKGVLSQICPDLEEDGGCEHSIYFTFKESE